MTLEVYPWAKYLLDAVLRMEDAVRIDFWCLFHMLTSDSWPQNFISMFTSEILLQLT